MPVAVCGLSKGFRGVVAGARTRQALDEQAAQKDYLTDVLSGMATRFVEKAAGAPFLIEVATFAPHAPYTPAPRDADAFPGLRAPRTAAFDAAPDASSPRWLAAHAPLSAADVAAIFIACARARPARP